MIHNTDLFSILNGSLVFQYYQRSRPIRLNLKQSRPINDIYFRFLLGFDSQGRSPHDVRFYINNIDVTPALRETIIDILEGDADDSIKNAYQQALDLHIQVYGTINETVDQMKAKVRELLEQPLKNQFTDRIGDFAHGWSGHLGLVNFLYRDVDFPEISISSVIAIHSNNSAQTIDLDSLDIVSLQFSHGEIGSIDPLPRGQLSFEYILNRVNPLLSRLEAAEERISELNGVARDLSQRLSNLVNDVDGIDSRVATIANELSSTSQELHAFVDQANSKLSNLENRTTNVVEELKRRETKIVMKAMDGRETIHIDGEKGDIRLI